MARIEFNGMTAKQAMELLADQPAREDPKTGTIFIRIPREHQRMAFDGCCGSSCCNSKETGALAYWDTAAVHPDQFHCWTVHYPDMLDRPGYPKRAA